MSDFQDIYDAPVAKMKAAIDDWRDVVDGLLDLHASAESGMLAKSEKADWEGVNSDVTKPFIKKTTAEFNDAAQAAKGIADILNEGYLSVKTARDALREIVDTEAPGKRLKVDHNGKVTAVHSLEDDVSAQHDTDHGVYARALSKQRADIADLQKRINRIVEECRHDDEWTARTLESNITKNKHNFSKPKYRMIDDAEVARAVELTRIVTGEGGTARHLKELRELRDLMHTNARDPEFSTDYYRRLGPQGALDIYAKMSLDATSLGAPGQDRVNLVHGIQTDMGNMLGTATRAPGGLDHAWTTQLMKVGHQQIDVPNTRPGTKIYGYQTLGALIRNGKYDTDFLTAVARDMTAMDKKDPGIWTENIPSDTGVSLNLDEKGGRGFNPITGMLEAMTNNPNAATDFFNEPVREDSNKDGIVTKSDHSVSGQHGEPQGMVDYFLDKGPLADLSDTKVGAGAESTPTLNVIGNALEVAVTHRSPGDLDTPLVKHTEGMANVMERVVSKIGEDPTLVAAKPGDPPGSLSGLSRNFGDMAAEYMPDLQASAENGAGLIKPFGHQADFPKADMTRFLGAVGQDPDSYGSIRNAQQAYTTALVRDVITHPDKHPDMGESVRNAVHPGGEISGMMTEARAQAIHDRLAHNDEEYNKAVEDKAKWTNRIITAVGAKYVELLPVGGDVAQWLQEDITDSAVQGAKHDTTEQARREMQTGYANAEKAAKDSARSAVAAAAKGTGIDPDLITAYKGSASTETATAHSIGRGSCSQLKSK
ncbi:hypothetical protein RB200_25285 [Streptomyces sp. PmtG]